MARAKILIVEDESLIAEEIRKRLLGLGYDIVGVVTSGLEAVKLASASSPDLILMDVRLRGDMDGIEAAAQIRRQREIPIIFLTAYADDETLERAKRIEPFGYILKPFRDQELVIAIDMALYKHSVETRLRKTEQLLAATLNSIGEATITTDMQGHVTFMNPMAQNLTGVSQAAGQGRKLAEVFRFEGSSPGTPFSAEELVDSVLRRGTVLEVGKELFLVSQDGTRRSIQMGAVPLRENAGGITGVAVVFRDTSEVQQTEELLRTTQEFLERLLANLPHSVYVMDREGRLRLANRAWLERLDSAWENVRGRKVVEIFPLEAHFQPTHQEVLAGGKPLQTEGWTDLCGQACFFQAVKFPLLDARGTVEAVGTLLVDLTGVKKTEQALRQSEERHRVISELTSDYAYMGPVDVGGTVHLETVSQGFTRVTGYSLEELNRLGGWPVLIHPDDIALTVPLQAQLLAGIRVEQELRIRTKAGATRWIRYSCQPYFDKGQGRVTHILGAVQDISDRKLAQEKLHANSVRLEKLSRRLMEVQEAERRHLARELHDEIGQVLTAVHIILEGLKGECSSGALSRIDDGIAIVQQSIQQVRAMSLDLRPSILDDFGLAAAVRWYADRQAQRSGLKIHLQMASVTERLLPELETTCFRVVQEALTNIVRHARAQNVWIKVTLDAEWVSVLIRDDGVGFDVPASGQAGESLGLLSMQERVQLLHGQFVLRSTPGEGTTIEATLPRKPAKNHNAQYHNDGGKTNGAGKGIPKK